MFVKLYIRQKVFSFVDRFNIYDISRNIVYFAKGEPFSLGKNLHIYDASGREVAYIAQLFAIFEPRFVIYINGIQVAQIKRNFSLFAFPPADGYYTVQGLDWHINGDIWQHDYEIYAKGRTVASMHKEWLSWGDCDVLSNDCGNTAGYSVLQVCRA